MSIGTITMSTQKPKTVLAISDVFSRIPTKKPSKCIVTLDSGQRVPVTPSLVRIFSLHAIHNHALECSICGCMATHLQQDFQLQADGTEREIWQLKAYSKESQRQVYLNVDHILPRSMGGTLEPLNMRIACSRCNVKRGSSLEGIEFPEHIQVHSTFFNLQKTIEYLIKNYATKVKKFNVRIVHFKNYINNFLIARSQSYRRTTDRTIFRKAVSCGLIQIGFTFAIDELDAIVDASAIAL